MTSNHLNMGVHFLKQLKYKYKFNGFEQLYKF
jgi:hypothetical protein